MRRRKKIPDYTKKAWPIETGNTCGRFRMTLLGTALCLIFPVLATGTEYTGQITGDQTFSDGDTVHVTTGPAILHDWSKNKVPSQTISGTGKIDVTAESGGAISNKYTSGHDPFTQTFEIDLGTVTGSSNVISNSGNYNYNTSDSGVQTFQNIDKIVVTSKTGAGIVNSNGGRQTVNGKIGSIETSYDTGDSTAKGISNTGNGNIKLDNSKQYIHSVGNIGSAEARFGVGILSQQAAHQEIGSVGDIYARTYGIQNTLADIGDQIIGSVGTIDVGYANAGKIVGAAIYSQSNTGNTVDNDKGGVPLAGKQVIGMKGDIKTLNAHGIRNLGGVQEITALRQGGITIDAQGDESLTDTPVYALAVKSASYNYMTEARADTALKGSFDIAHGDVLIAHEVKNGVINRGILRLKQGDTTYEKSDGTIGVDNTLTLHDSTFQVDKESILEMDDKGYNIIAGKQKIDVQGTYRGNGTFIFRSDNTVLPSGTQQSEAATIDGGPVLLKTVTRSDSGTQSTVNIQYGETGKYTSDNVQSKEEAFSLLKGAANKIYVNEGIENIGGGQNAAGKVYMREGKIHSWSANYYFDKTGVVQGKDGISESDYTWEGTIDRLEDKETSTMTGIDASAMINYFAWRQETETLSQRLGDIRNYPRQQGGWARVYAARSKYDKGNHYFRNDYRALQFGYDRPVGNNGWIMGGALSYTDGDSDLKNGGDADNWMLTGAVYGTWHNEKGHYVDLVGKVTRMHNKYKVISDEREFETKGSNSNWAYSISAEYGRRFRNRENGYFAEPQIQMTLGRIEGSDYKTNNGIHIEQDSINSAIGRIGVAFGRQLEKGSYFIRLDGLHEFDGKMESTFREDNGSPNRSHIDFSDTWGEVSVGGNWQFDRKSFGYAQVKRSFAADIETQYRVDIGIRYLLD